MGDFQIEALAFQEAAGIRLLWFIVPDVAHRLAGALLIMTHENAGRFMFKVEFFSFAVQLQLQLISR